MKAISVDKKHLRHWLLFTFPLEKTAAEAKQRIFSGLGGDAIQYSTSKKWFQTFKSGNLNLEDEEHPAQPPKLIIKKSRKF